MSVLTIVESTPAHLHAIIMDPSEITRREMERAGQTPWQLLKSFNELLRTGRADTLRIDGEPAFVFGHNPHHRNVRVTWFVAAQRYFDLGARGVVFARGYLRRFHGIWPGTSFESYSYSDHPDLHRWFLALGFNQSFAYDLPEGCTKFTFHATAPVKSKKDDTKRVS